MLFLPFSALFYLHFFPLTPFFKSIPPYFTSFSPLSALFPYECFFVYFVVLIVFNGITLEQLQEELAPLKKQRRGHHLSTIQDSYLKEEVESIVSIVEAEVVVDSEPVLRKDQLDLIVELCTTTEKIDEHKLIVHFTPILDSIIQSVNPALVIVNSEEYKWLEQHDLSKGHNLKPDLVVIYKGLHLLKPEPKPTNLQTYRHSTVTNYIFQFGVPTWEFLDSIKVVVEWKSIISPMDRTVMYRYLLHLSFDAQNIVFVGLLCDAVGFYLMECVFGDIRSIKHYSWTNSGSLNSLRDVFLFNKGDGKWIILLNEVLNILPIRLVEDGAFLGKGGFGRVFKVKEGVTEIVRALKIVLLHRIDLKISAQQILTLCRNEFEAFAEDNLASQFIVGTVTGSFVEIIHNGGLIGVAYLLQQVGEALDKKKKNDIQSAFQALSGIHSLHRYHGDARFSNAISVSMDDTGNRRTVKWIDFMQVSKAYYATRVSIQTDIRDFVLSVVDNGTFTNVSEELWNAYIVDPLFNCQILFDTVFAGH
jgi:hypothetical protein